MNKKCLLILSAAVAMLAVLDAAHARPPYKKEWETKYLKKESPAPADKALVAAADVAKCNVCHVGKNRKDRNAYGEELAKFLNKNDVKNVEKIQKALADVENLPSQKDNPNSPTFGALMKEGKLPAGDGK